MKKSILLVSSVMLLACSSAFGQKEEKKENIQLKENVKVEKETTSTSTKTEQKQVKSAEPVKLKKELINKKAVERKTVRLKAEPVREEKIED